MKRPGIVARRFIRDYPALQANLDTAAKELVELLHELIDPLALSIDAVSARPKAYGSVIHKTIKKGYGRPSRQMMDFVGARVVTLYASGVDQVVEELKATLDVDATNTVDKRNALTLTAFGYRSVHIVAKARAPEVTRHRALDGLVFEVQVRSVLEHSWAEIEHQVVYKSGVRYEEGIRRQFAALAAVIEMLDGAFVDLQGKELRMRGTYAAEYAAGREVDEPLDTARLAALMSTRFPGNPGWKPASTSSAIAPDMAPRLIQALELGGITTARNLNTIFATSSFRKRLGAYAAATGRAIDEVSHSALVLLALGGADPELLQECFPLEAANPNLANVLGLP